MSVAAAEPCTAGWAAGRLHVTSGALLHRSLACTTYLCRVIWRLAVVGRPAKHVYDNTDSQYFARKRFLTL